MVDDKDACQKPQPCQQKRPLPHGVERKVPGEKEDDRAGEGRNQPDRFPDGGVDPVDPPAGILEKADHSWKSHGEKEQADCAFLKRTVCRPQKTHCRKGGSAPHHHQVIRQQQVGKYQLEGLNPDIHQVDRQVDRKKQMFCCKGAASIGKGQGAQRQLYQNAGSDQTCRRRLGKPQHITKRVIGQPLDREGGTEKIYKDFQMLPPFITYPFAPGKTASLPKLLPSF